jgi:glycosyltransferase involved in cell wall biosynthesis
VFIASPLWAEPFGLSMIEAMACGTPVAALPNGAARELVTRLAGSIAKETTVSALAAAIISAAELRRADVRSAAAGYSSEVMVDRYLRILENLTDDQPGILDIGLAVGDRSSRLDDLGAASVQQSA